MKLKSLNENEIIKTKKEIVKPKKSIMLNYNVLRVNLIQFNL